MYECKFVVNPTHSGIGIDDMFVVIQCFNNLPEEQTHGRSLKDRIALTMQVYHAYYGIMWYYGIK